MIERHDNEITKSHSYILPQKSMHKDVFSILLFTLSLVINICLTNTKYFSYGNSTVSLTH